LDLSTLVVSEAKTFLFYLPLSSSTKLCVRRECFFIFVSFFLIAIMIYYKV